MATDEEIRAKDVIPKLSEFREGDGFYGDGQTSFFMDHQDVANNVVKDSANNTAATEADLVAGSKLPIMTANGPKSLPGNTIAKASEREALAIFAQNVSASIAPDFDANRTSENAYRAGQLVTGDDGKTYIFKRPHYGAWNADDVMSFNIERFLQQYFYRNRVSCWTGFTSATEGSKANSDYLSRLVLDLKIDITDDTTFDDFWNAPYEAPNGTPIERRYIGISWTRSNSVQFWMMRDLR